MSLCAPIAPAHSDLQGYLLPAVDRPNLHVLTEAYVTKIVTSKSPAGEVIAQAVEFQHGGSAHVVHVAKEAILSAG